MKVCGSLPARRDHELTAVIPPLLSGRPVVDTEMGGLPYLDLDEASVLNENARMRMASHQLRELVTTSILQERPRIGVILSSNRPSLLPTAIAQLRAQRYVDVELRVGIHSKDEVPDLGELSLGSIVDASIVPFDPSDVFGDVLQELTDAGSTEFLTKWDDDDRYGPFHLFDLWLLAKLSRRYLVGQPAEFVHLKEQDIVIRRRGGPIHTDSRFLAGGALLISRRVLANVGGWSSIPRRVDLDLIERFERTREIGLLRAVGMTRRQLRRAIRWEAVIIAIFGAILGLILGVIFGVAAVVAIPDTFINTVSIPYGSLVVYLVIAGIAGIVAAILPARRAARLNVLDAISHD